MSYLQECSSVVILVVCIVFAVIAGLIVSGDKKRKLFEREKNRVLSLLKQEIRLSLAEANIGEVEASRLMDVLEGLTPGQLWVEKISEYLNDSLLFGLIRDISSILLREDIYSLNKVRQYLEKK